MKRTLLLTAMLAIVSVSIWAQETTKKDPFIGDWYVGAQLGMPMAEADFSSFGADHFRPGWTTGIHAGYRFTRVWSLELNAQWGQQFMAEQACCFERGYFLGNDHNRYRQGYYLPAGTQGWFYTDLKSRVFVQRYGLQLNMNILGFFSRTKDSPWQLDISPAVYAVGTHADLMTKADNTPVADNLNTWHLGYGGQAQLSYHIADNMRIGIYGGFTHLTGKPMDGMPELHTTNYIIDAGVKFSFAFGKVKSESEKLKTESELKTEIEEVKTEIEEVTTEIEELNTEIEEVKTEIEEVTTEIEEVNTEIEDSTCHLSPSTFPTIYFSFNSIWIEPSERAKVKAIADMMKADRTIRIRVTGWSDSVGSEEANQRVSLQRAEAVKRVLGQWLIPAERVETIGAGIKHDASNAEEARHAATIEITNNK